jgi:septation ring formation regulator EzrA
MVVALEQARYTEQQLTVMVDGNAELQRQLEIVKATVKLLEDQIAAYKTYQDTLKSLSEAKDEACKQQIKAATPTFWDNLQKYFVGMGIGGVLVGIGVLLI